MDDLGHCNTEAEIRTLILKKLAEISPMKVSWFNARCSSESMLFKVLADLKAEGLIDYDDNFVWKLGQK